MPESTAELYQAIDSFQKYEKRSDRPGWKVTWGTNKFPGLGKQKWPQQISITTEEDFLFLLHKEEEVVVFRNLVQQLVSWNYRITEWLIANPLSVLKYSDDWKGICAVTDILQQDVSQYYSRNLPVDVHTKFIESHRAVILSILKSLDPERFPENVKDLESAAGLLKKPHLYSIRWLDKTLAAHHTAGFDVLALPLKKLQEALWDVREVWLVENETNLYLLESRQNALAIFAQGYALHHLKEVPFLREASYLFYWGDLDEDGFCMLDQFRRHYPRTISLCMDEETVSFHQEQIHPVKYRFSRIDLHLEPPEMRDYLLLLEKTGRIEQEKLQQAFVREYIQRHLPPQ
jgi:hypothetical protein